MGDSNSDPERDRTRDELAKALPTLNAEQLVEISPHLQRQHYDAGQDIIRQGEAPGRFFILVAGAAEIWHADMEGEEHLVDRALPGEYFGETGLIHNYPRSATVRVTADGPAEVLALDKAHFLEMIAESRATESEVAREMIQRLIELSRYQD